MIMKLMKMKEIKNISQLSDYVTNYNFGDLVAFSDYRDTGTYIIGKNGELVYNPDYSNSGYLTIPYEITQYLDDAVNKYQGVDTMYIDLDMMIYLLKQILIHLVVK